MNPNDPRPQEELPAVFRSVRRGLRALTAAVFLMALALVLDVIAVFGRTVEFDGYQGLQRGSIAAGAAIGGFAVGWIVALVAGAVLRGRSAVAGNSGGLHQQGDVSAIVRAVRRRVRALTVVVLLMTLGLMLNLAAVFGVLVEYHAREPLLRGGATAGVAVLGLIFGWIARRRS
jgi:uncharacterized membrane protein YjfL (UPF0719 family)